MPRQRRQHKPKKPISRTAREKEETGWWTIKCILEERKLRDGTTEYLVDWEGEDPNTGQPYSSSWTQWVTPDSLEEWAAQKRKQATEVGLSNAPSYDSEEDIRPFNWRRSLQRPNESTVRWPGFKNPDHKERPKNTERPQIQDRPSEEPPSSVFSTGTGDLESQTSASIHSEAHSFPRGHRIAIEFSKPPEFDPTEYQSVAASTQSSQLLSQLEEEDHRTILAAELSQRTIPDSQEASGPSNLQSFPIGAHNTTPSAPNRSSFPSCIPDSQDQSLSCPILSSQSHCEISIPSTHDTLSEGQTSSNSDATKLDIPSRQPEQSQPCSLGKPELLTGVVNSLRDTSSTLKTPSTDRLENATSASVPHGSVFLTQPLNRFEIVDPTSSLPNSLEAHSSRESQPDSHIGHLIRPRTSLSSLRESQEAQYIPRDFDFFPGGVTISDSVERSPLSGSESRQACAPGTVPRNSRKRCHRDLDQGHSTANISQLTSNVMTPQAESQSKSVADMEESGPTQRSAVDELKSLFNFGDALLPGEDYGIAGDAPLQDEEEEPLPAPLPTGADVASNPETAPQSAVTSTEADIFPRPPLEVEPWKPEVLGNPSQDMPPPSISPASIMHNPNISSVDALKNIVDIVFDSSNLVPGLPDGTISPADIDCSIGPGEASGTLSIPLPSHSVVPSGFVGSSGRTIAMGQGSQHGYSGTSSSSDGGAMPSEHVITLPFQASRRPYYDDTLLEYKREAEEFGEIFNSEVYREPDEHLVKQIDELFGRLFNICDYPQDVVGTELEDLPANQQAKYSNDANPKFNFTYELLDAIHQEKEVLLLARTPELLRLLHAQTETLELDSECRGFEQPQSSVKNSSVRITLALSSEDIDPFKFDVIIGFDHTFNHSPVSRRLSSATPDEKAPLVLHLVTTHSIEHIYLHIPQDLSPLERKHALLSGIVQARSLIEDPDTGYREPHQIAKLFSTYLNDMAESISWEPQSIPDNVIDFFLNTQSLTQVLEENKLMTGNGLKRKLDAEHDSDDAKRMRVLPVLEPILESSDPPLPHSIRELLKSAMPIEDQKETMSRINVPLAVLDALAKQIAESKRQPAASDIESEYKATISRLEKQVKEYQRTTSKTEETLRQALQDRSSFETAKLRADEAHKAAIDTAQKESEKSQKRISELESTVTRLTAAPDGSEEESPLARTEKLLEEAQKKVKMLEKRLENAQHETDYIRNIYQDVNSNASALAADIKTLRQQNEDLQLKASENLKHIHQIQADTTKDIYLNNIAELKTLVREQEYELSRLREDRLFRNGRPSTRQASVPRSPRMGVMSPRPGRGYGSASRGTSPAPGDGNGTSVQFIGQQPGNNRFGSHLRD